MTSHHDHANLIWQIADPLRSPYRPPHYERVMLLMTGPRRFALIFAAVTGKIAIPETKA